MTLVAHISDPHFGTEDPQVLAGLLADLDGRTAPAPAFVAVSGDLTQRARTEQFRASRAFLDRLTCPYLVVPGNHDVPLYNVFRRFLSPLTRYKKFIDETLCPFIQIDGAAVLGINTARSLTFKNGHVSHEQMDHIRETFADTDVHQPRILVTHHPLFALPVGDGPELGHLMDDQQDALTAIADAGVDLLLAGHNHRASINDAAALVHGSGKALVIQAGTATSTRVRGEEQSFNRIEIDEHGVRVTVQRWNGSEFLSGDSEFFKRIDDQWQLESGENVEPAPAA